MTHWLHIVTFVFLGISAGCVALIVTTAIQEDRKLARERRRIRDIQFHQPTMHALLQQHMHAHMMASGMPFYCQQCGTPHTAGMITPDHIRLCIACATNKHPAVWK